MIKKIFFGGIVGAGFVFITMGAGVIRTALAVRFLSPELSGVWFLFWNIIAFVSFCDFGLSPALSREIGFASKKKNPDLRVSNLFLTIRRMIDVISLAIFFLLIFFGYLYFHHLSLDEYYIHQVLYTFYLFSVAIVIQFRTNPYLAFIYGRRDIALERFIRAIGLVIGVLVSSCLVFLHYGLIGLVIGYVTQSLTVCFLARYFFKRKSHLLKYGRYLNLIVNRLLEPCVQWTIMSMGATLIFQSSNFIISYLMGVQYVPHFAVLMQIAAVILNLSGIIGLVLVPFVSKGHGEDNGDLIKYLLSVSARFSTAIAIILAVFFYFSIDSIIKVWMGNNFVINQEAFLCILIMTILETQHVACAVVTMAVGYVKFALIAIIAGILNVILSFVLIHFFGLLGASLSILVSQLLTNNWYVVIISLRCLNYSFFNYIKHIIIPLLLLFSYMFVAEYAVYHLVDVTNLYIKLLVSMIFTIILCGFGVFLILLTSQERLYLKNILVENWGRFVDRKRCN